MFDFRIIETADGNQIIDRRVKTPYSALTPMQMAEYIEMDVQLMIMDRMKRMEERRRKPVIKLLYRLACLCGMA